MFKVSSIIYIYLAIIILLIIYNLDYMIYEKLEIKRKKKYYKKYKKIVLKDLKNYNKINENSINYFSKKLSNVNNLIAYNKVLCYIMKHYPKLSKKYFKNYEEIFINLTIKYNKYESMKKAYYLYVLRKIFYKRKLNSGAIINYTFNSIQDKSIYVRENAILFLLYNANALLVLDGLKIISKNDLYYNQTLITDDLIKFKGNTDELKKLLIDNFNYFNDTFKVSIINYFRFTTSEKYIEFFYELLKNDSLDKEVYLSVIRIFGKYKYEKCIKYLIKSLQLKGEENFEYRLVASSSLGSYKTNEVKKELIKALNDLNFNVRKNVAIALSSFDLTLEEEKTIENDKYAKEMLDYIKKERRVIK